MSGTDRLRAEFLRLPTAVPRDAQADDLLEACYERNIHSRGDMEYAFQPWAINVERLAEALWNVSQERGVLELGPMDRLFGGNTFTEVAEEVADEYTRLAERTDR